MDGQEMEEREGKGGAREKAEKEGEGWRGKEGYPLQIKILATALPKFMRLDVIHAKKNRFTALR